MILFTNYRACALKWFENNHMKANPSKFQAILFKCRKDEVFDLDIGDELIKPVSLVKLLAVFIDDNLSFNEHVSTGITFREM